MARKQSRKSERVTVPVSMTSALDEKIEEAARRVGLSKQDTMRLSMERGLSVLISQLTTEAPAMPA